MGNDVGIENISGINQEIEHTPDRANSLLQQALDRIEASGKKVIRPVPAGYVLGYDQSKLKFPTIGDRITREIIVERYHPEVENRGGKRYEGTERSSGVAGTEYIVIAKARNMDSARGLLGLDRVYGIVTADVSDEDYQGKLIDAYNDVINLKKIDLVKIT